MFHTVIEAGADGTVIEAAGAISKSPTSVVVLDKHLTHFNVHALDDPRMAARWHNALQAVAERTPHGIPVTISTDPRHAFIENAGVSFTAKAFSQWPEPLGLAALRDADAVREFADIARQEYVAVGIRAALHPTLDLATEPRWGRQAGTFGQDPGLVTELGTAYLEGFQHRCSAPTASPAPRSTSPAAARRRTARTRTSPTGANRSIPVGGSPTTCTLPGRHRGRDRRRSCPTTGCRSGSRSTACRSRRSGSATTRRSSPACCASSSATTAWCSPTGSWSTTTTSATRCCRLAPGASSTSTRTSGWSASCTPAPTSSGARSASRCCSTSSPGAG